MDKTIQERRTEEFVNETNSMVERLKKYQKDDKKIVDNIKYEWVLFSVLIDRAKGKCSKEIMHEQGKKVVREFKRFEDKIQVFKDCLPEIPEEKEEER